MPVLCVVISDFADAELGLHVVIPSSGVLLVEWWQFDVDSMDTVHLIRDHGRGQGSHGRSHGEVLASKTAV